MTNVQLGRATRRLMSVSNLRRKQPASYPELLHRLFPLIIDH